MHNDSFKLSVLHIKINAFLHVGYDTIMNNKVIGFYQFVFQPQGEQIQYNVTLHFVIF